MIKYEDMTPGEIYQERIRYLLSADDMIEEMLDKVEVNGGMKPINKAGWICCGVHVHLDNSPAPGKFTGEQFPVCDETCRDFSGNASLSQARPR